MAFDPTLDPVRVDKMPVSGVLYNTGQSLVFRADTDRLSMMPINMTGGPFSYRQAWNRGMDKKDSNPHKNRENATRKVSASSSSPVPLSEESVISRRRDWERLEVE